MRRFTITLLALLGFICTAYARFPHGDVFLQRLQFGVELGYSQTFYKYQHYNIVSEQGYRIDETSDGIFIHPNGSLLVNAGYDAGDNLNLALYTGYIGVSEDRRLYPVLLRFSYYPNSIWNDGIFTFIDVGAGISVPAGIYNSNVAVLADAGGGYRIKLFPFCNLDFLLSLKSTFDSPLIPNPEGEGYVSDDNIRSNYASYYALSFSIALNF